MITHHFLDLLTTTEYVWMFVWIKENSETNNSANNLLVLKGKLCGSVNINRHTEYNILIIV